MSRDSSSVKVLAKWYMILEIPARVLDFPYTSIGVALSVICTFWLSGSKKLEPQRILVIRLFK